MEQNDISKKGKVNDSSVDGSTRFLASTLHEIRTPIQTIISTIELLQNTNLDKEQTEYIRQIQFSAEVLLELANNILDFTKIRSTEFKLESIPFDITSVTEQVVDLISIDAFNRGLEIITDLDPSIPPFVTGDPVRVQQIILNLVKNAVKFTNEGYILVSVEKQSDKLYFEIKDSGIGISEEKSKKLFTDYFQGDVSTYRKFGGTGLGLSIAKNLVTAMGGKIGERPNPEGGSIFWFEIPLSDLAEPEEIQPTFEEANDQNVLIVDDNDLAAKNLQKKLEYLGFKKIKSVKSASQAMNELIRAERAKNPYTTAFIDMAMPQVDGWHLASEINSNPEIEGNLTLLLLVPEGQMGSEAKMKMLNWVDGYLYKPVKLKKLLEVLKSTLSQPKAGLEELEMVEELGDESEERKTELPQSKCELRKMRTVLPSEISLQPDIKPEADDTEIAAGYKILIAEDHPVNRKLLETFLRKFGADVYSAGDGLEALSHVKETPDIDMIFMDIFMPNMNGLEATEALRKSGFKGIIIACTANNDETDFAEYRKIGMNDILVKPFKSLAIKEMIEKWSTVLAIPELTNITMLNPESANQDSEKEAILWDKTDFLDTVAGNNDLAVQMLDAYYGQTEEYLVKANEALGEKDFDRIRKIAHALKGSSATISAEKLAVYAEKFGAAARAADINEVKRYITEFESAYCELKKLTHNWKISL